MPSIKDFIFRNGQMVQVFIPSDHTSGHVQLTAGDPEALPLDHHGNPARFVRITVSEACNVKFGGASVDVSSGWHVPITGSAYPVTEILGVPPGATHIDASAGTVDVNAAYGSDE